jgi:hypothetical protein
MASQILPLGQSPALSIDIVFSVRLTDIADVVCRIDR